MNTLPTVEALWELQTQYELAHRAAEDAYQMYLTDKQPMTELAKRETAYERDRLYERLHTARAIVNNDTVRTQERLLMTNAGTLVAPGSLSERGARTAGFPRRGIVDRIPVEYLDDDGSPLPF